MKIYLERSGGFAGIRNIISVDSDSLHQEDNEYLNKWIDKTKFFNLPAILLTGPSPRGAADYINYKITIESGDRRHTVAVSDINMPYEFSQIIDFIKKHNTRRQ